MKKLLFIISVLFIGLVSCSKDDSSTPSVDLSNVKQTWIFTVKTVTNVSPAMDGFPTTDTETVEQSNLTEAEAKQVADSYKKTSTMEMNGMTFTISVSATYAVKK